MRDEVNEGVETIDTLKKQLDGLSGALEKAEAPEGLAAQCRSLKDKLESLRAKLAAEPGGYRSPAKLRGKINSLLAAIGTVSSRPTAAQAEWIGRFDDELQGVRGFLEELITQDVAALNRKMNEAGVPRVFTKR